MIRCNRMNIITLYSYITMPKSPKNNKFSTALSSMVIFLILIQMISKTNQYQIANLRLLDSSSPQSSQQPKPQQSNTMLNLDKNTFLLVLIIGSVVFVVVALICCVVCVVRCVLKIQRRGGHGNSKIGNVTVDVANLWSGISYALFEKFVGTPFHTHCVICLEDFKLPPQQNSKALLSKQKTNKQEMNSNQLDFSNMKNIPSNIFFNQPSPLQPPPACLKQQLHGPRFQSRQTQYNEDQQNMPPVNIIQNEANRVKLTVCGHLLHEKCINQWFQKQQICPLCRQQFTYDEIKLWNLKLGVDLFQFSDQLELIEQGREWKCRNLLQNNLPIKQKVKQKINRSQTHKFLHNETLNTISKSRQSNQAQEQIQIENRIVAQNSISCFQKQILLLYCLIMAFHHKLPETDVQRDIQGIQEIIQNKDETKQAKLHFQEHDHVKPSSANAEGQLQETVQLRDKNYNQNMHANDEFWDEEFLTRKKRRHRSRITGSKLSSNKPGSINFEDRDSSPPHQY